MDAFIVAGFRLSVSSGLLPLPVVRHESRDIAERLAVLFIGSLKRSPDRKTGLFSFVDLRLDISISIVTTHPIATQAQITTGVVATCRVPEIFVSRLT